MIAEPFVDYYETLEISPSAQPETIHRVYRLLAQLYHPDNIDTGEVEKFNRVLQAYKVLSDPAQRAAYDIRHRSENAVRWRVFSEGDPVQGLAAERSKRNAILTALYTKRVNDPDKPGMNAVELEQLLGCSREHMEVSLWYLRESGRVTRTDNGRYALTAKGLETLEEEATSSTHKVRPALPAPLTPMDDRTGTRASSRPV
ncbi:MAG TPA: J domain-containing protein [Bryobacteraceae bacterium]|nr:J domain-containing protein [Bryobacteraceae bacterium]